jgi:hypothetical protein
MAWTEGVCNNATETREATEAWEGCSMTGFFWEKVIGCGGGETRSATVQIGAGIARRSKCKRQRHAS